MTQPNTTISVTGSELFVLNKLEECGKPMSAADLWNTQRWWQHLTIQIYPALLELERKGLISSEWVEGQYPRRRVYQVRIDTYRDTP